MPRRLTNPKAEVAGLSSSAEEVAKAGVDEYTQERPNSATSRSFRNWGDSFGSRGQS